MLVASKYLLEINKLTEEQLKPARFCLQIQSNASSASLSSIMQAVESELVNMSVSEANMLVRALGRVREGKRVFALIEAMKRSKATTPNEETFEFLANALVLTVERVSKVRAMADLPSPSQSMPEVVFVGRSNVGKSSLVNYMVNRRALASISATPGHTKHFHFFAVNKGRSDNVPSFYLVDVPGLGYAEAEIEMQDSWRNLLERYMSVRDTLSLVFHLVDGRHGLTATDHIMLQLVKRALQERREAGKPAFRFVVILTKMDKAKRANTAAIQRTVEAALRNEEFTNRGEKEENMEAGGVSVIETSAVSKEGRDALWKVLYQTTIGLER